MSYWGLAPVPEEELSREALVGFGAILIMVSRCFRDLVVPLRLDVSFTICFRL